MRGTLANRPPAADLPIGHTYYASDTGETYIVGPATFDHHGDLGEAVFALLRGERPSLAWVVRWSYSGIDPIYYLWERTHDGFAMATILRICGESITHDPTTWLCVKVTNAEKPKQIIDEESIALSSELRRRYPVPPTLAEVLAKIREYYSK